MNGLLGRLPASTSHRDWAVLIFKLVVVALAIVLLAATFIDLETTSRSWDPFGVLLGAERAWNTHQPFYVGATDQKGPLWLTTYTIAYVIGGQQGAWFVVGAMVMLIAALTAGAAWLTASRADDPKADRVVAGAAAAAFFIYLTLGKGEFQHTLYSRNIVSLLFALAVPVLLLSLALTERRRKLLGVAAAGVLVGLAVQTNIASAPTAIVFGLFLLWLTWRGKFAERIRPLPVPLTVFFAAGVAGLVSAMVWYALRGVFSEFWTYWWDYNREYASATNTSTFTILKNGLHDLTGYYREHPLQVLIIALLGLDAIERLRKHTDASLNLFLLGWWLAECLAVTSAQRFFDAYLILPAVPIGFMAVLLAARHGHLVTASYRPVAVAAIVLGTLYISGGSRLPTALDRLADFRSPAATIKAHRAALPLSEGLLANAVDANSKPSSYVYAWTDAPWIYTDINRREASRFAIGQWLSGVIPFAATGPQYVIPDGWQKWAQDLRRTPPVLWLEFDQWPVPAGLPVDQVRDCAFKQVYSDQFQRVYKRVRPIGPCLDQAPLKQTDEANARARNS